MGVRASAPGRVSRVLLAKCLVSSVLLAVLFWRIDRAAFLRSLQALPAGVFLGCTTLYFLGYVISTVRWRLLLRAEGIRLSVTRLALVYFQGAFFNLFLPTLIGGDVVRGLSIYRLTGGHPASLASILVDRLSGFAALLGIALVAVAASVAEIPGPQIAGMVGMAALFLGLVGILTNARLTRYVTGTLRLIGLSRFEAKVEALVEAVFRYRTHRRALLWALLYSLLLQALIIVTYAFVGRSMGLSVPIRYFFLYVPLITVLGMLPVSVAGLGVREGSVVYFFGRLGVDPATALSMSLVWFSLTVVVCGLGGLAFLASGRAAKRTGE
jgi:uncharacterized protein (TIRG00374 family)